MQFVTVRPTDPQLWQHFVAPTCKQSSIDSQGIQLQTRPCFPETSSCRKRHCPGKFPLPGGCSVFLLVAWSVIKITTACKAELFNVGFLLLQSRGDELLAAQMGFYSCPFGTSAMRNMEEYDMGNIQHQEEGWSRLTTTQDRFQWIKGHPGKLLRPLCSLISTLL